ncbi:hypothetical protein T439DRAFT_321594 [Meredithblackwellia eburnea MCA 4105]
MASERAPLLGEENEDDVKQSWFVRNRNAIITIGSLAVIALLCALLMGGIWLLEESRRPTYDNRIILIRHGEKPKKKTNPGLSKLGRKRAQCLRSVFGNSSSYDVGLILAESYNEETGIRGRPYFTVAPVAADLGLEVDVSCKREDMRCIQSVVGKFAAKSDKDILICWKHTLLTSIAQILGSKSVVEYPEERFDLMWVMTNQSVIARKSENCKGIDDGKDLTSFAGLD